jgi:glutamine synthetase adenylyltransferase
MPVALRHLVKSGIIDKVLADKVIQAARFMRTVEAIIRLNEEKVLKKDSGLVEPIAEFFGFSAPEDLPREIDRFRSNVLAAADKIYS